MNNQKHFTVAEEVIFAEPGANYDRPKKIASGQVERIERVEYNPYDETIRWFTWEPEMEEWGVQELTVEQTKDRLQKEFNSNAHDGPPIRTKFWTWFGYESHSVESMERLIEHFHFIRDEDKLDRND